MITSKFNQNLLEEQAIIGRVITQATAVESILDSYIAEYYVNCRNGDYLSPYLEFIADILVEQSVSLNTKIDIIYKIHKRIKDEPVKKSTKKLYSDWLKIRNLFAHGKYVADRGLLYKGRFFNIKDEAEKHATLQIKVLSELDKLAELRGPYFNYSPLK